MQFSLVGINHQTASVAVREKVAIGAESLYNALSCLRSYIPRGVILSTCNRTEIYTADGEAGQAKAASLDFLTAQTNIPEVELLQHVYVANDTAAIEHLCRVASGLESMIVGEFEVLGQVRQALEAAEKVGMVNLPLRHIFQSAIRTGRQVREETGISRNAVSTSSVAVELATKVVGDLSRCKILVIGAGEAGRLVVKVARERGVSRIVVASRTKERASALAAALGGVPVSLDDLTTELSTANIVVTCAGAPHRILDAHQVAAAMRHRPELPLVIIDIAVPRDVAPAVREIANVFLYNIDDLTGIASLNLKERERDIQKANQIIASEVSKLVSWWQALKVRPLVSALMSKAETIRVAQLDKTLKKLPPLSDEERESLEAMTRSIITKILKDPVSYLKRSADNNNGDWDPDIVSRLFQLDVGEQE